MRATSAALFSGFIGLTGLIAFGSGCTRNDGRSPVESAQMRSQSTLHESVTRGYRAASRSGPFEIPIRYNPASCECPPHEVYAFGRWLRVFVEADDPAQREIAALRSGDPLATASIRGQMLDEVQRAENGVEYPVFTTR